MSDIVERLNRGEGCLEEGGQTCISMNAESGCLCAIAADEITRLTAELRTASDMNDVYECRLQEKEAENEKLRAALKQAGTGLNAGLFQYAARDIHGNIVPGDEQYPWIRAMQIGLDAVTAALRPPPALKENNND